MNKISVITVTYNSERTIKECLESIKKFSPESEIIVVDNGSNDRTLEIIESIGKKIKLIETGENLGFSKANNLGAKDAIGDYLVFLNPDAILTKNGDLESLKKILEKNPQYAILGPKLIYPDNALQPKARNLPTVFRAFEEYVLGLRGAYSFYEPKCQNFCEVESVNGACMIIRKELFNSIGGFDEKYFMYYEELDLCRKLRKLGKKIGFAPEAVVIHAEGISSGQNEKTAAIMKDSAKKYFGLLNYFLLQPIFFYNRILNRIRKTIGLRVYA